ncbi:MAG: transglycosylase domain-containing protein [Bacteroidales bacterium]|nr:transglycosylase domain-containing protein [Bacteroidales bacterium]
MIKIDDRTWIARLKDIFKKARNWVRPYRMLTKYFFKALYKCHKATYENAVWHKRLLIIGTELMMFFFFFLICVDINAFWLFGKSPSLMSISNPQQSEASEIFSADDKIIGKYFKENRMPVDYEEIAPIMIKTLICTEDERFYQHFGIDVQGLFAAARDMTQGHARGASTITQQLVKNMFKTRSQYSKGIMGYIPGVRMIIMKSKEWITAVKIELFYSKEEILTMYLNTVDFGSNAYGIKTACKTYFNNSPSDLTVEQAATLVGLLKATTYYNPKINPKNSLKRRNVVLENLLMHKVITSADFDSLKNIPIRLQYKIERNYDGNALYFREAVAAQLQDWCEENDVDLYSDGLKIYTTIDTRMQKYAEEAVDKQMRIVQNNFNNHWGKQNPWQDENHQEIVGFIETLAKRTGYYKFLAAQYPDAPDSVDYYMNRPHKISVFDYKEGKKTMTMSTMDSIRYMEHFMHTGFVAMEPQTGYIKAWVGDVSFNFWKYDKVLSKRQPGSTFKLFVYTTAFNKGMSPCDYRQDKYIDWEVMEKGEPKLWMPHNANGVFTGQNLTLKAAFARSINSVAVALAKEVGISDIIETAYAMGIKTPLHEIPSVSLGASDVSLLELVNSYCTVVNDGMTHDPVLVTRIEDRNGKVIFENKLEQKQAISYQTAFLMTQMLRAGMTEPMATTQALWSFDLWKYNTEFGGKTGTSSNHSDAWFVGVTPRLIGGAWVGGEHRSIHFRTGQLGEGSKTALPIFGYFMEKVLADQSLSRYRGKFPKPKEEISVSYDCQTAYTRSDSDSIDLSDSLTLTPLDPKNNGIITDESLNKEIDELLMEEGDTKTEVIKP